jgi:hypothetical protein
MLGRHVYRVAPLETGGWAVQKEGEATARGSRDTREEAVKFAWELAAADEPSRVVVEDTTGAIVDEREFGIDLGVEPEAKPESAAASPPGGDSSSRSG